MNTLVLEPPVRFTGSSADISVCSLGGGGESTRAPGSDFLRLGGGESTHAPGSDFLRLIPSLGLLSSAQGNSEDAAK
jgi:hypothetical protein